MEVQVEVMDITFDVKFDAEPYVPAQISGPPESCYPAEGGTIDIESIMINGVDLSAVIDQSVIDLIEEKLQYYCNGEYEKDCIAEAAADRAQSMKDDHDGY